MTVQETSLLLYHAALLPVAFFSLLFLGLTLLNLVVDKPRRQIDPPLGDYPFITVQVPSFNDPVAIRCLTACLEFTYPQDRYEIMSLDDSTEAATARLLEDFSQAHGDKVRFIHRDHRAGYKPGALQAAMPQVKGELIVIFDADFVPQPDFLELIAQPFQDPNVAIVQARQGFLNTDQNLVTLFASYLLGVFHFMMMPINNWCNTVFFCGTAGALRRSAVVEVGGWNTNSITEDCDLSVRLLAKGYRSVYLPFETPSEVPVTLKAFLKQQMRWCFGNVRVYLDNLPAIFGKSGLQLAQRALISIMILGHLVAPAVILMTIAGFLVWLTGSIQALGTHSVLGLPQYNALFTSGYTVMGMVMLHKRGNFIEIPRIILASLSIGLVLAGANSLALYRAVCRKDEPLFARRTSWVCTPKTGNAGFRG